MLKAAVKNEAGKAIAQIQMSLESMPELLSREQSIPPGPGP